MDKLFVVTAAVGGNNPMTRFANFRNVDDALSQFEEYRRMVREVPTEVIIFELDLNKNTETIFEVWCGTYQTLMDELSRDSNLAE